MYFNTSGKLATADNRELSKAICAGLLVTATTGSDEVSSVLSGGKMEGFSGLTAGIDYYLGNSGNLITKGAIGYAEYIVYIGRAISTTEMDVKVMGPEPARNQDDSIDIGNAIAVYGTTDSKGYLYADGRAISRVNYSILFGVIGTTFGVGDGSTTFNIPDQADYAALGDATLKWHIKAENVMTSGEVISAMRDDQGWVEFTGDWTNKEFIVTPAPGIGYSSIDDVYGLQVEIWLADDDTPTNPIKMLSMERAWDQAAPAAVDVLWGLGIMPNNTTSFKLQTGKDGVQYLTDNGTLRALETSTTGAYKVVITKPNLVTTIFDVSSLPQNVDLTAGNVQVTLPEITGALQTKSIYWTNGGTYKLTLAVTDAATIGGLAATIWEGESEGHIELESDGTNWQVREYKDSGTGWTKDSYGEIRFSATKTFSAVAITSATTPIPFRSDGTLSVTLPYANLIATDYRITLSFIGGIPASMINLNAKSSTSFTVYLGAYTSNGAAAGAFDYNGVGRWRT
ncbi:tail fiber protein [Candidatus Pacearchaeota archaeon]|nr:tail fiber protein [Candidatus Pacearchaeota archaeon]